MNYVLMKRTKKNSLAKFKAETNTDERLYDDDIIDDLVVVHPQLTLNSTKLTSNDCIF